MSRYRPLAVLWLALLTGCLPVDVASTEHKTCAPTVTESKLTIRIESVGEDLPGVLSGLVNRQLFFDECQTATSPLFSVVRTDARHATLQVNIPAGSKMYDDYFDESGAPRAEASVVYWLYGRPHCSDDALVLQYADTPLAWQAQPAVDACSAGGYAADVATGPAQ